MPKFTAKYTIETVDIIDVDHEGRGVAKLNGKTCFVPGALTGEQVNIRRIKRLSRFDEAELVEVITPSPDRISPECAHFDRCGGCSWQHVSLQQQLSLKQAALARELWSVAQVAPQEWLAPIVGESFGYRRKARLGVKQLPKSGRAIIGFRERNSSHLANVRECKVLAEPLGRLCDPLGALIGSLSIGDKVPQLEVAVSEARAILIVRVLAEPSVEDRQKLLEFARENQVEFWLQPKGPDSVVALTGEDLKPLSYTLTEFNLRFEFTPMDFIQVNALVNERMVVQALNLLDLQSQHRVVDFFCGLGNFTLPLSTRAAQVVGVEGDDHLLGRARQAALTQGIDNARFEKADLFNPVGQEAWLKTPVDRVLLDPPRAGAKELIPYFKTLNPARIVYVSCHPGTLARDVGLLKGLGYTLEACGILDMFSHTAHVESMAVLSKGV